MKVSPWFEETENGVVLGSFRFIAGTDPTIIANRVAFIEKTPRIRVRGVWNDNHPDHLNWASAPFKGDGPEDQESKDWCDKALVLFGYKLENK